MTSKTMSIKAEGRDISELENNELSSASDFLKWEEASRDTIDVKRCYIDVAGDLVTGILLSQITYWFLPNKGKSRLRIKREGKEWLAKSRTDWWDECRISQYQFDRSIKILRNKGLVQTRLFHFGNPSVPTLHVHLDLVALGQGIKCVLAKNENRFCPKDKIDFTKKGKCTNTDYSTQSTNRDNIADGEGEIIPQSQALLTSSTVGKKSNIISFFKENITTDVNPAMEAELVWCL